MAFKRSGRDELVLEPDPATWSALEEKIFIHLMVKEVHKGNRSATTFSRNGWKHIEQEFLERTGRRYNNSQFRNKFNQLRTRYFDFSRLLKEPGFYWDPVLNNVAASERTWDLHIQANRSAKRFRKKGCLFFNELDIIFGDPNSKYKDATPLAQFSPLYNEDNLEVENASTNATPSIFHSDNSDGYDQAVQSTKRSRRQQSITPTSHIEGKQTVEIEQEERERTETSNEFDESGRIETRRSSKFSITKCVRCLEAIEGVGESSYLKAINMFKDVDWREMFLAMSEDKRLVWLGSL